ncbi:VPS9 domain-containing protein [Entamoeba marina]
MQRSVKDIDEEIHKQIKTLVKTNKSEDIIDVLFDIISDYSSHPLLDVIESALQTLFANIKRIPIHSKGDDNEIAIRMKDLIQQTTTDLNGQIVAYYHLKKVNVTQSLYNILFDLCFDTIKDVFIRKDASLDFQFHLQCLRLQSTNLRLLLKLDPPKYPEEDLDVVFKRTINTVKLLHSATTLSKVRDLMIQIQKVIVADISSYNNGKVPEDFATDNAIDVLMYAAVRSNIQSPFSMISFLTSFMSDGDNCTEVGFSIYSFQIGMKTIINKL